MVKFKAQTGNRIVLGFGLTARNVELLKEKKPIHISLDEMGLKNVDIILCYGDTEKALMDDLQQFIGPDTDIKNPPKLN